MQTKEINNGRLAMIGVAGMLVQELVNGKGVLENLGLEQPLGRDARAAASFRGE
jgi:hypothetical protein